MLKEGDLDGLSQIAASLNPLAKVTPAPQQWDLNALSAMNLLARGQCRAQPHLPSQLAETTGMPPPP